ncbi:MAG TPA: M14 family metallopeptidase [Longimicrobiaceae bacterium]|nr:M14 family metallopeptidase [Longimicrobiaceae bacterium]
MPLLRPLSLAALLPLLAALPAAAQARDGAPLTLRTRPERTEYRETSRYDEVVAFLEAAARAAPDRLHLTTFGYTFEGRPLPLAVWGTVRDATPEAVLASGKTRVYLQGNIHAGEVEGKEALQVLLRDLVNGRHREWADSLVLLIAPIYNADGNERISLVNRPHQHGPVGGMGQRPNAQGLDLNRDHTKLDSPEARSLVGMLNRYDPHVLVDLHTTNGTYHAYHLTYAPPLHPATDPVLVDALRAEWLPRVTRAIRETEGWDLHYYGNVPSPESPWAAARGAERGWYTFDHRPRFGNNYAGLRNRFGILSEAYAHLTFRERIEVTRRFVEEVVGYAHRRASLVRRVVENADRTAVRGQPLALRARHRRTGEREILMGAVAEERNPYSGEPMMRRLEVRRPERMADYSTFEAAETERVPGAYLVPATLGAVTERLAAHGIRFRPLAVPTRLRVEEFRIDSTRVAAQEFQGHRERTVWGRYVPVERVLPAGTLVVPTDQPLGRLAFILLEPRSDDGFLSWNLLGDALQDTGPYPVLRTPDPVP